MRVLEFKLQHAFVSALIRTSNVDVGMGAVISGTKITCLGNRSIHDD
jgi:hypothetical protein